MHGKDFQALVTRQNGETVSNALEWRSPVSLSPGEVRIRTAYAGVNYKDCLAIQGQARIIRDFPRVGGIEAVGQAHRGWHVVVAVGVDQDLDIGPDGVAAKWAALPTAEPRL